MPQGPNTRSKQSLQKMTREAQSTSPQQPAATQSNGQRATPAVSAQAEQLTKYEEARKYLVIKGILDASAPCTPSALATVLKSLATTLKLPEKVDAILTRLREVALGMEVHAGTFNELRSDIQLDLDDQTVRLSKQIEDKVTVQKEVTKAMEKLEEAAKGLESVAASIGDKLATVTNSTSQLANTANSYRDALLRSTPLKHTQDHPRSGSADPAVGAAVERKERQVLVQLTEAQLATLSQQDIIEKATQAMKQIEDPPPPEDITITQAIKLRRGVLILQFKTKEAVEWIQSPDAEISFSVHFLTGATIKPRQYVILVPRAPTTFDPDNEDYLREIEESNGLPERTLAKAKWIKPVYRHKPEQQVAHVTFMLSDPKVANKCIREGMYICGMRVHLARLKQEPTQCMKCRRWGHFANECLEEKDTCGMCGGEHRTNSCTEAERRYCASCKMNTHAS